MKRLTQKNLPKGKYYKLFEENEKFNGMDYIQGVKYNKKGILKFFFYIGR